MPVTAYFGGHGSEVMTSIRRAHPNYSEARVKSEFYATAHTRKQKPVKQRRGTLLTGEKRK